MVKLVWNTEKYCFTAYRYGFKYRLVKADIKDKSVYWFGETADCDEADDAGQLQHSMETISWWAPKESKAYENVVDLKVRNNGEHCIRCEKLIDPVSMTPAVPRSEYHNAFLCDRCYNTLKTSEFDPHPESETNVGYWVFTGPGGWVWYDIYPNGHRSAKSKKINILPS